MFQTLRIYWSKARFGTSKLSAHLLQFKANLKYIHLMNNLGHYWKLVPRCQCSSFARQTNNWKCGHDYDSNLNPRKSLQFKKKKRLFLERYSNPECLDLG